MKKEIDLNNYIHQKESALIGRDNGEGVFKKLEAGGLVFNKLEQENEKIVIKIPERIVSINKSFFLGLFETIIERLGKQKFYEKYEFNTTDHIKRKIEKHIEAALLKATQKEILDG